MQETNVPPSRFRWSALLWFLPAALVLLAVGIWAEQPWWVLALWVVVPLGFCVVIGMLGGRRTSAPDHAYGITSQGAHSEGRLEVDMPVEQVLRSLRQVVEDLPRFTLVELSGTQAQLTARMNMKSWGERITLHFHPLDPTRTEIEARCEPRLGTTMVDYGQGAKDLRTLLGAIEQHTARNQHIS